MTETIDRPAIASAVIVKDGQVLLTRRRKAEGSFLWALPGGEIEGSEGAEDAAVREVLEETGLTVAARRTLGARVHPKTGVHMTYVACDVITGDARLLDTGDLDLVEWVPIDQTSEKVPYGFFEPVQQHLDAALVA